jgi:hypothetical protein
MKKLFTFLFTIVISIGIYVQNANAQMSVTVTDPTNATPNLLATYGSFSDALIALNAITTMSGPVTLTCTGSETAPAGGFVLGSSSLNVALNAATSNMITIIGPATINAGTGINAAPSVAAPDGMFKLVGVDRVTIDNITFTDGNSASATVAMEFGLAMFKFSTSDGCNYNMIQNCTFNMQRISNGGGTAPMYDGAVAIGIYNSINGTCNSPATPISIAGSNSYNKIYTNTINGGNIGIGINGYAASISLADQGNDIGGTSALTGNNILNYGGTAGATNPAAGIRTGGQYGLNISYNTINNNNGSGVDHPSTIRGIFTQTATSASETIAYNNITVSCGSITSQLTAIENTAGSTASSNTIDIHNNTIVTYYPTASASGVSYGIYNNGATPSNLYINNNNITNNTACTTGSLYPIYNTGGVFTTLNINSNTIVANLSASNAVAVRGIYCGGVGSNCSLSISNNIFNGFNYTNPTNSTGAFYAIYQAVAPLNVTINNNNFNNLNIKTTAAIYLIYNSYAAPASGSKTVQGNYITTGFSRNTTSAASSAFYCYYDNTASPSSVMETISGNNFSNITANTTGAFSFYGLYLAGLGGSSGSSNLVYGNTVSNITSNGTNAAYGIYIGTSASYVNVYRNSVNHLTSSGGVHGIYVSGGTTVNVFEHQIIGGNDYTINNLTSTGATTAANGITVAGGTTVNVYKNCIHSLSNSSSGTTVPLVNGILLSAGTTVSVYNNIIGNLTAPSANSADAIRCISMTGTGSNTAYKIYFNTIDLEASSSAGTFGTTGIFHTSNATATNGNLDMINNIVVNNSGAKGTAKTVALRKSTSTYTNWNTTSNNNLLYAPILFSDGTVDKTTLTDYQSSSGVSPRDANSRSLAPSWAGTVPANANYLHINTGTATYIESGGKAATYTADFDGDLRFGDPGYTAGGGTGLAPDIGADEFAGVSVDITAPAIGSINYMGAECASATGRSVIAVITDFTGVNNTTYPPQIYFRKNSDPWFNAAGTLSSGTINNGTWTFPITYATLGGVAVADNINYYIVAQDVATTPNAGGYPSPGLVLTNTLLVSNPPTTPLSYVLASNDPVIGNQPGNQSATQLTSATFTVGATGVNLTYKWQEYITSWNDITNGGVYSFATTANLVITNPPVSMNGNYYRCVVTSECSPTPVITNGNALLTVTLQYCTNTNATTPSNYISSFSTTNGVTNITNNVSGFSSNGYGNFTAMSVSKARSESISFSIISGGTMGMGIWVDWNQNGSFADAGEQMYLPGSFQSLATGSFTVPATALLGSTRMRVVGNTNVGSPTACTGTTAASECEDYTFTVLAAPPPTITSFGSSSGCVGSNLTINGTYFSGATAAGVTIGGTPVTSIVSNSGTVLVVKVGAGTTGTVSVTANGGTVVSVATFTVNQLPVIDANTNCLMVGSTLTRTATPSGGTWLSGTPGVATIHNTSGLVTGVAAGSTVITYTAPVTFCTTTVTQNVNALLTGTITPTSQTACNPNQGDPIVVGGALAGATTWVNSPLASAPANTGVIGTVTPTYNGSYLELTQNALSQFGGIYINNTNATNSGVFNASFDINMYPTGGADGASFNFGPDVPTTLSALNAANGGACEKFATATGLAIQMETYGTNLLSVWYAGVNVSGTYPVQLSAADGTFKTITISVNSSNQLTVAVGGTAYITNYALPAAYGTANKSTWFFGIDTRSGGVAEGCRLKNLSITTPTQYEYSFDGGSTFQASSSFTPPAGANNTYTIYVRPIGSTCASLIGTSQIASINCAPCVNVVSPLAAATNIAKSATLNWDVSAGATGYKIYFGTNNPPTNIANGIDVGTNLTYDPNPDMNPNVTYYWRVSPYNAQGATPGCTVWSFTTACDIPGTPTPATATSPICIGSSSNLNAISAGNTILWYDASSGGNLLGTVSSGTNFAVTPALGTTNYYAAALNGVGCAESPIRAMVTVTVNPLPTITGNLSVCAGSTTQLSGSGTPNVSTPWVSSLPGVATISSTGLVYGVAGPGTTVITYKDNAGCTVTATVTVAIAAPAFTASASSNVICAASPVNLFCSATGSATLISPTGDGGFENGSSFAANGWTPVLSADYYWQLGTTPGQYAGARSAYVGTSAGTWSYDPAISRTSHIYRDVAIPAGSTNITLSFYWKGGGEGGWDRALVYTAPTSVTPAANVPASSSTALTGATLVWTQPSVQSPPAWDQAAITLPGSLAGTTVRLIFTWQSDVTLGDGVPAAIDNISLTTGGSYILTYAWTSVPAGFTSSDQNPTGATPTVNTNYIVTVSNPSGCTASASTSVSVNTLSVAPTSISGNPDLTVCLGGSTTLTAVGGSEGTNGTTNWYKGSCDNAFVQEWFPPLPAYNKYGTNITPSTSGILEVTANAVGPYIDMAFSPYINPDNYKYIQIRYLVLPGQVAGNGYIQFLNQLYQTPNIAQQVSFPLISDNDWHILTINMATSHANWNSTNGNIRGWRYYWATTDGSHMLIDYIKLGAGEAIGQGPSVDLTNLTPAGNYNYYVSRSGYCNTTSCANATVTVAPNVGPVSFTPPQLTTRCSKDETVTYSASEPTGTGVMSYALDPTSITGGVTIVSNSGLVHYPLSWVGTSYITATATKCGPPQTATYTVTTNETPSAVTITPTPSNLNMCSTEIKELVASGGTSTGVLNTILTADFENPVVGWTKVNNSIGGTDQAAPDWTLTPDGFIGSQGTFHSNTNNQFYLSNSDAQGDGETHTILISPAFSTVGYSTASISFWHYFNSGNVLTASVEYSINGTDWYAIPGLTWDPGYDRGSINGFVQDNASLASLPINALGQASVRVRFKLDSYITNGYYWAIDNVKVEGNLTLSQTTWSPTGGLYTDAGAGTGYTGGATTLVYAHPTTTTTYTATATALNGCFTTSAVTLNVTTLPIAGFSYTGTPYCSNASNPFPAFVSGGVAGVFTVNPTDLHFVSNTTGEVNISASSAASYTITNTIVAAGGCPEVSSTAPFVIHTQPVVNSISYVAPGFCKTVTSAQIVTRIGDPGGEYTSTPVGLILDQFTGDITPSSSSTGTYSVTYTVAVAGCASASATTNVTITALPVATFEYSGSPYVSTGTDPLPTYIGAGVAGVFSEVTNSVVFIGTAGQVDLSASTPGTYTVTNFIAANGGCADVTGTAPITINAPQYKTLSVKVFVQGLYLGGGMMNESYDFDGIDQFPPKWAPGIADTVTVELYDDTYGSKVARYAGVNLSTSGLFTISTVNASLGGSYYITIFQRNSLPITTASAQSFSGPTIYYDFTYPIDQAYGAGLAPQKDLGDGFYGMYTGALDQINDPDYVIDVTDLNILEPVVNVGPFGYLDADLDGSGFVDVTDLNLLEPNVNIGPRFWNPLLFAKKKHSPKIQSK